MANNRYSQLKTINGIQQQMPFIRIPESSSDKYITWKINDSRFDILSDNYYGSPMYDYLLNYANPQYISEFDIVDGDIIRIPFPLDNVLINYNNEVDRIVNK